MEIQFCRIVHRPQMYNTIFLLNLVSNSCMCGLILRIYFQSIRETLKDKVGLPIAMYKNINFITLTTNISWIYLNTQGIITNC